MKIPGKLAQSFLIATLFVLASPACSKKTIGAAPEKNDPHAVESDGHDEHEQGEIDAHSVRMDEAAMRAAGIELQTVEPSMLNAELRASGEVIDNAYGTTLITPRVEALVVSRHARIGDEVEAGAPLVTLSSVDVANAQADLRIAEDEWQRVSALGREAVSGRRINEAKVAVDRARATARAYGLMGKGGSASNGEFTLSAPHAGRLTEDDFLVGQRIEPGTTLFRLVDESIVWIDATLPSGIAPQVEAGAAATVILGDLRMRGTVMRSVHKTSETTRNTAIRIEVPNPDDTLHAGDYVDVYLQSSTKARGNTPGSARLALPSSAVVRIEGETVVFRRDSAGALQATPVQTGEVVGDLTVIVDGLKAGDSVVVAGAFSVKSQLLKAQMGEGHAH